MIGMPRPLRIQQPGVVYHAMSRGNDGQPIFRDDGDFLDFLRLVRGAKKRFRFKLYAYCLMPNHFHLLLRQQIASISDIMQWLLACYAQAFNHRSNRRGHLFQDRFLSPICKDDRYFLRLLRYIHLNPVKSKLVLRPEEWSWSGHDELVNRRDGGLLDSDFPLSLFHHERDVAVAEYKLFLASSEGQIWVPEEVNDVPRGAPAPMRLTAVEEVGGLAAQSPDISLEQIAAQLCQERNLTISALQGRSRVRPLAQARKVFVRRAAEHGIRPSEIAAFVNRLPSAISNHLRAGDVSGM